MNDDDGESTAAATPVAAAAAAAVATVQDTDNNDDGNCDDGVTLQLRTTRRLALWLATHHHDNDNDDDASASSSSVQAALRTLQQRLVRRCVRHYRNTLLLARRCIAYDHASLYTYRHRTDNNTAAADDALREMCVLSRHVCVPLDVVTCGQACVLVHEDAVQTLQHRLCNYRHVFARRATTMHGNDDADERVYAQATASAAHDAAVLWSTLWCVLSVSWRQRIRLLGGYALSPLVYTTRTPTSRSRTTWPHVYADDAHNDSGSSDDDEGDEGDTVACAAVLQLPPASCAPWCVALSYAQHRARVLYASNDTDDDCSSSSSSSDNDDDDAAEEEDDGCALGPLTPTRIVVTAAGLFALRTPLDNVWRHLHLSHSSSNNNTSTCSSPRGGGRQGQQQQQQHCRCRCALFDVTADDVATAARVPYMSPEVFARLQRRQRRRRRQQHSSCGHNSRDDDDDDERSRLPVHSYADDVWSVGVLTLATLLCGFCSWQPRDCHLAHGAVAALRAAHADDTGNAVDVDVHVQEQLRARMLQQSSSSSLLRAAHDVYADVVLLLVDYHGYAVADAHSFVYDALHALRDCLQQQQQHDNTKSTGAAAAAATTATAATAPSPVRLAQEWRAHLCRVYHGDGVVRRRLLPRIAARALCTPRAARWRSFMTHCQRNDISDDDNSDDEHASRACADAVVTTPLTRQASYVLRAVRTPLLAARTRRARLPPPPLSQQAQQASLLCVWARWRRWREVVTTTAATTTTAAAAEQQASCHCVRDALVYRALLQLACSCLADNDDSNSNNNNNTATARQAGVRVFAALQHAFVRTAMSCHQLRAHRDAVTRHVPHTLPALFVPYTTLLHALDAMTRHAHNNSNSSSKSVLHAYIGDTTQRVHNSNNATALQLRERLACVLPRTNKDNDNDDNNNDDDDGSNKDKTTLTTVMQLRALLLCDRCDTHAARRARICAYLLRSNNSSTYTTTTMQSAPSSSSLQSCTLPTVPATVRGEVWSVLLDCAPQCVCEQRYHDHDVVVIDNKSNNTSKRNVDTATTAAAAAQQQQQQQRLTRQLAADIPRCHRYLPLLRRAAGQRRLWRVLTRWLALHPTQHYWQGLDSVCAVLLWACQGNEARVVAQLQQLVQHHLVHHDDNDDGDGGDNEPAHEQQQQAGVGEADGRAGQCNCLRSNNKNKDNNNNNKDKNKNKDNNDTTTTTTTRRTAPGMQRFLRSLTATLQYTDATLAAHLLDRVACACELFAVGWGVTWFAHVLPVAQVCAMWDVVLTHTHTAPHCFVCVCCAVLQQRRGALLASHDAVTCLSHLSSSSILLQQQSQQQTQQTQQPTQQQTQRLVVRRVLCDAMALLRSMPCDVDACRRCCCSSYKDNNGGSGGGSGGVYVVAAMHADTLAAAYVRYTRQQQRRQQQQQQPQQQRYDRHSHADEDGEDDDVDVAAASWCDAGVFVIDVRQASSLCAVRLLGSLHCPLPQHNDDDDNGDDDGTSSGEGGDGAHQQLRARIDDVAARVQRLLRYTHLAAIPPTRAVDDKAGGRNSSGAACNDVSVAVCATAMQPHIVLHADDDSSSSSQSDSDNVVLLAHALVCRGVSHVSVLCRGGAAALARTHPHLVVRCKTTV